MTDAPRSGRPLTIEERLYADETRPDRVSHLEVVTSEKCLDCAGRECMVVCRAGTYRWDEEERVIRVNFENCLECGACRLACPHANISWRYPMGRLGICYRYGCPLDKMGCRDRSTGMEH